MNKNYLITAVATIFIMAIFFWRDHSPTTNSSAETEIEVDVEAKAKLDTQKKSDEVIRNQLTESQNLKENANQLAAANPEAMVETQRAFAIHLKQLGQCFGLQMNVDQDQIEPQFSNLATALSPALGDVLLKLDDWTQFDVQLPDGSQKRVRTEVEYLENNTPTTRLQLYKLNEQGMPELQKIEDDLATNPDDGFLNGLRQEGKMVSDEKGLRAYFSEGEELVVVEKNGKIQSYSLSKGERSFSCSETDSPSSRCQCL